MNKDYEKAMVATILAMAEATGKLWAAIASQTDQALAEHEARGRTPAGLKGEK